MKKKKKIRAPSKILWKLRYKGAPKCPHGELKNPKGKRKCKLPPGRPKKKS